MSRVLIRKPEKGDHFQDIGVDEIIILQWFRTEISGRLLRTNSWTMGSHNAEGFLTSSATSRLPFAHCKTKDVCSLQQLHLEVFDLGSARTAALLHCNSTSPYRQIFPPVTPDHKTTPFRWYSLNHITIVSFLLPKNFFMFPSHLMKYFQICWYIVGHCNCILLCIYIFVLFINIVFIMCKVGAGAAE
jgi:hypothetical protein